jgi:hypothetical protein
MELEPVEAEEVDPLFAVSSGIGLVYAGPVDAREGRVRRTRGNE